MRCEYFAIIWYVRHSYVRNISVQDWGYNLQRLPSVSDNWGVASSGSVDIMYCYQMCCALSLVDYMIYGLVELIYELCYDKAIIIFADSWREAICCACMRLETNDYCMTNIAQKLRRSTRKPMTCGRKMTALRLTSLHKDIAISNNNNSIISQHMHHHINIH